MAIIRTKNQEAEPKKTTTSPEEQKTAIDNKLELLKYAVEVRSKLKQRITSDFVLCKLGEQDRIGVTETTVNAYLAERQIINLLNKSEDWNYYPEEQTWKKEPITKEVEELIKAIQEKTFTTFMTKVEMTAILGRNVENNHMVEVLSGLRQTEIEDQEEGKRNDGVVKKLLTRFKKKETEEDTR